MSDDELYEDKSEHKKINIFLDLDQSIISGEILKEDEDDYDEDEEDLYDIESNKTKAINFDFQNMENLILN